MTNAEVTALLARRWKSEADAYSKQVEEARAKGLPHDQMLATMTTLRKCAKELEVSWIATLFD